MGRSVFFDLSETELNIYTFESGQGKPELKDSRKYPVSGKYDISVDFSTDDIENAYLSLPLSSLNFRVIDLPFSDKNRIKEVLPFELDGMILGGSESMVFDNVVLSSSDNKYQILAVYVEKKFLREILGKLKSYNIDPVFVTSLELRDRLKNFAPERLLPPVDVKEEDRVNLSAEEIKAPTIDFRKDEFAFTRDKEKTMKSLRLTVILAVLLALVLSSDLLFNIISAKREAASLKNDIRKQYMEIFPGEKNIMNELYQMKSHMKELKDKEDYFVGVAPLSVLYQLSQVDRQGTVFNEISVERGNLILKGEAPSLSAVQQLKGKLDNVLDGVNISDSKTSAQGNISFTITAKGKKA